MLENGVLRRIELSFLAFGAAESGVWLAVLVYAFQRGGATLAGVIAVVQLLPAAAVAPVASRSVDRRGAGPALRAGYAVLTVTIGLTAAMMLLNLLAPVVYLGAVAAASAVTLVRPAQLALLPELVSEPAELTAANSMTGWAESISLLVGPALAGVMMAVDGPGAALLLFAAAIAVATMALAPLANRPGVVMIAGTAETAGGRATATLRHEPGVRVLLGVVTVEFVALGALDVLEVVLAVRVLGLGAGGAGYLAAAYGVGGVIGAAGTVALVGRRHLSPTVMLAAAFAGGSYVVLGAWPTVATAFTLLCVIGVSRALLDVGSRTILHRIVPALLRARVFGAQEGLSMLGLAAGSIAVPPLVHAGGVEAALVAVGGLLMVGVLGAMPRLNAIERGAPVPQAELEALRCSALFGILPAPVLEDLARALTGRTVAPGEVVVREGEQGERFYLIGAGELYVTIAGRRVATLGPGDGFGEIALLREGIRVATVTARSSATLYALEREPFLAAVTGSRRLQSATEGLVTERLGAR